MRDVYKLQHAFDWIKKHKISFKSISKGIYASVAKGEPCDVKTVVIYGPFLMKNMFPIVLLLTIQNRSLSLNQTQERSKK